MKTEPIADSPKTACLIGAGASASETSGRFPCLLGIANCARRLGLISTEVAARDVGLRQLNAYLKKRAFGDLLVENSAIDLEAALSVLEIDIAVDAQPGLELARSYLISLLRRMFTRLHSRLGEADVNGQYARLISELDNKDSIISFNWDLLLDNALGRERILRPGNARPNLEDNNNRYVRFLREMTAWGEGTIDSLTVPPPTSVTRLGEGYFIKAHGSIDWYACSNPSCTLWGRSFPLRIHKARPVCGICAERVDVLLVPPTLNKRLRETPLFRRLWTRCAHELSHATHIFVWGYSLPPTDFFSAWLLRNVRAARLRRVTLIDPLVTLPGKDEPRLNLQFVSRFASVLNKGDGKVSLSLYRSFDEFTAQNDLSNDPKLRKRVRAQGWA